MTRREQLRRLLSKVLELLAENIEAPLSPPEALSSYIDDIELGDLGEEIPTAPPPHSAPNPDLSDFEYFRQRWRRPGQD